MNQNTIHLIVGCVLAFFTTQISYTQVAVKGTFYVGDQACIFAKLYVHSSDKQIDEINAITDTLGNFSFQIPTTDSVRSYSVRVAHVEVQDSTLQFTQNPTEEIIDLGTILLEPATKDIQGVEISSKKPTIERKIDRLVFNIEGTSSEFGLNAFTLLSRTPLVFVQGRENITVIGKGSATVIINDRLIYLEGASLVAYLESIPSSEVDRIEVITNPPVKYEARGVLINIVLKKNKMLGLNGRVTASHEQGFYGTQKGSLSLNYRKSKMNMYGLAYISPSKTRSEHDYRYDFLSNNNIKEDKITKKEHLVHRVLLGMDYTFSEKNDLSITVERTGYDLTSNSNVQSRFYKGNLTDQTVFDSTASVVQRYENSNFYYLANAQFNSVINKKGGTMVATVTYSHSDQSPENQYTAQNRIPNTSALTLLRLSSESQQLVRFGVAKLDFEQPTTSGKFTYGARYAQINNLNNNSIDRWVNNIKLVDTLQNDEYDYTEYTSALYASYFHEWERHQVQLGLRGEYTQLTGKNKKNTSTTDNDDFTEFFPTLEYMYILKDGVNLQAALNRSVTRPSYSRLNPFRNYSTVYRYERGNPSLRPTLAANAEAGIFLYETFWFGGSYLNNRNVVMPVSYSDSSTNYEIADINQNIGDFDQFSVLAWLGFGIGSQLNGSIQVDYTYNIFTSNFKDLVSDKTQQLYINTHLSYALLDNLSLDVDFTANPLGTYYTIRHMEKQYLLDVGATQRLLNNQLVISVQVSDIFKMREPVSHMNNAPFILYRKDYWDTFALTLSAAYSFGNRYINNKRYRSMGIEEEKSRM